jgi:hypothetical protein
LLHLFYLRVESQNFGSLPYLDNNISPYYIEKLIFDSTHNKLIISSKFMKNAANKYVRGIASWNCVTWDSLSSGINTHDILNNDPNGTVLAGIPYNNKLLVGGYFQSIGKVNATCIALWDGIKWDSLPVRPFKFLNYNAAVYGFFRAFNKLYVYGQFDTIQNQKANGLATLTGNVFTPVSLPLSNLALINSMILYKNELYIAGNFYENGNPSVADIYKFNGTSWVNVGGSIKGTLSSVSTLTVYNNELYVGGNFSKASGNAGNSLMKWDGIAWHDAGWGENEDLGVISKLLVHNGKLYAFGSSNYCSGFFSSKLGIFDGSKWCSLVDTIENAILSAEIYKDTIYVAGAFKKINSDTSKKFISKLSNTNIIGNCNILSIFPNLLNNENVVIYPNPFIDQLTIMSDFNESRTLTITNSLGDIVFNQSIINPTTKLNLLDMKAGIYFAIIQTSNNKKVFKLVKK